MSIRNPQDKDAIAEEPNPQVRLDILLWKLDFFETIINELPNPVFAKTNDARFCFFNNAYESFFFRPKGRSAESYRAGARLPESGRAVAISKRG